ncbi:MAG: VTT domain-containing protein [Candidatus Saccharibacteria bacterium]|nr:VTT domain-containing protein [Candidatus Saccharibacteria bacterium]
MVKKETKNDWKVILTVTITIIGTIALLVLMWYGWKTGMLADPDKMQAFFRRIGPLAPAVFMLYQIVQVVIPLIPGGFSVGIGMLMFGLWWGLFLNVVPIIIGSMINFYLSKKYGWKVIKAVIPDKEVSVAKSWSKIDKQKFSQFWIFRPLKRHMKPEKFDKMITFLTRDNYFYETVVFFTMLLPGFPADLLCFIYGLMDIQPRRFFVILLITKPLNTLIYGWLFSTSVTGIFQLIQ